jgi:molybdate transport system ATP-binding protein
LLDVHVCHALPTLNINVRFQAGEELVVLFGPSGAGKSVVLRAIAGLLRPDAGRIVVGGRTLFDSATGVNLPPQERRVGYVPQHYGLFPHLSIADNIAYGLHRVDRSTRAARVGEMLELMRLRGLEHRRPGELSGGEQQRVALARALVTSPDILLLDEPLGALDAPLREHLQNELRQVQARYSIPTLLVTHNLAEAYSLAQRIVVLTPGHVVQSGLRDEVFRHPAMPEVAIAMGMRNVFRGRVLDRLADGLRVAWAGGEILTPPANHTEGQDVLFGIRPEEIMFVREDRPLRPDVAQNIVSGVIAADEPQGFDHLLTVCLMTQDAADGPILYVRLPHPVFLRLELGVGQRRLLSLKPGVIHLFPASSLDGR